MTASTSFATGLRCRECAREYPIAPHYVCEYCFGPLEVVYDYAGIAKAVSRERILSRPDTMWRYKEFLPVGVEMEDIVSMGEGCTPFIHAKNLGREMGLNQVYIKNDCANPTHSFKDRVVSVAVTKAKEFGFTTVGCASTGNLSNAVSAYGAKAGMEVCVFIPHDLEVGKIVASNIYGPTIIKVQGNYDEVNRLCAEVAGKYHWAFVNINVRPFYAEGSKSLGFEVVEQMGWRTPDHVVVPIASGSLLTKIWKAFHEFTKVGLLDRVTTKVHGAQAEGCSPVATAWKTNTDTIKPVKPKTVAKSLAIGNPADGYYALQVMKESGGGAESVTDQEIVEGMKLLARCEGIFTETAGGVTVGTLKKLAAQGKIGKDESVVVYITGTGLKTQEAMEGHLGEPMNVKPSLESFEASYSRGKIPVNVPVAVAR